MTEARDARAPVLPDAADRQMLLRLVAQGDVILRAVMILRLGVVAGAALRWVAVVGAALMPYKDYL